MRGLQLHSGCATNYIYMKDDYDLLRDKEERIFKKGLELAKRDKMPKDWCCENCASCLSAEARGIVDNEDYDLCFDSTEDICMIRARDRLAEKLEWIIN